MSVQQTVCACEVTIAGERVELLPERAAFWVARRTLIVSDLHLGKCETLRAAGVPIPAGVVERDLERLLAAVQRTGAERVIVVGDLIHHGSGLTSDMVEVVAKFRRDALAGVEIALVRGNHDRRADLVEQEWGITPLPAAYLDGPFGFAHDPADGLVSGVACTWYGHIHPHCRIGTRGNGISIPCFVVDSDHVVLPAFSLFTGGVGVSAREGAAVFGIAEGRVVRVPTARRG